MLLSGISSNKLYTAKGVNFKNIFKFIIQK